MECNKSSTGRWLHRPGQVWLFDCPYSDIIGLQSLLGYLNGKFYTAVTAQMLYMFPKAPLAGQMRGPEKFVQERHNLYDLSGLRRKDKTQHCGRNNVFDSTDIECLAGGIRERVFDLMPRLTKFPFVFWDGDVRPVEGSHTTSRTPGQLTSRVCFFTTSTLGTSTNRPRMPRAKGITGMIRPSTSSTSGF